MVKLCPDTYESDISSDTSSDTSCESYFEWFSHPLAVFQKHSIEAVVNGHHFLACVPTASGKTLCGEFGIRYAHTHGKRSIFLSPLKALSNQKYYDFTQKYPEITFGISTGDIKCGVTADCVIMTNEVFMNFLFNRDPEVPAPTTALDFQMDIDRDLGCVVFDEIHMINDAERGSVLEKIIMMLPDHVQMIMLSGTLDAPMKFAQWVESCRSTRTKEVWVASSQKRVVPLIHYGYVACTESFLKSVKDKSVQQQLRGSTNRLVRIQAPSAENGKNVFLESGYKEIASTLGVLEDRELFLKRKYVVNNVAQFLKEKEMLPAIFFVFSRKQVETIANEITVNLLEDDSKVPYIVRRECEQIVRKFPNHEEYLQLPEYNELVRLLEAGIGIHHAGMLQVLREMVEFMLSKKYIKILVCTSTFAAGLNFAIRTVVMTNLKIFNGSVDTYLSPQDYSQMGGRAGRLGIDTVGHVVHINNLFPLPTMTEYREMMGGTPQKLVSKFAISYSMILNLLKNGQTSDFHDFARKSMVCEQYRKQSEAQHTVVEKLSMECEAKRTYVSTVMRTPVEVCRQYAEWESLRATSVNKRRKQLEKDMTACESTYRYVKDDLKSYREWESMEQTLEEERRHETYLSTFLETQSRLICQILEEEGFVSRDTTTAQYALTTRGTVASNIGEIHPLVLATCVCSWHWMAEFSVFQWIGWLSIFVDVRVNEEMRMYEPRTSDSRLLQRILETREQYHRYYDQEMAKGCSSGLKYADAIVFDLVDEMMEWARDCEDVPKCKWFLQTKIHEGKQLSTGDFSKACMKIASIARELVNVCQQYGAEAVECMHKLSQVDAYLLKYVVSNQSLYI
jgi:superfamily II RNA helicase